MGENRLEAEGLGKVSRPPTFARRIDGNARLVIDCLRVNGVSVQSVHASNSGVPDLLCGFMGRNYLVEVKPESRSKAANAPRASQVAWAAAWRGSKPFVVHNAAESFELVALWRREAALAVSAAKALKERNALVMHD